MWYPHHLSKNNPPTWSAPHHDGGTMVAQRVILFFGTITFGLIIWLLLSSRSSPVGPEISLERFRLASMLGRCRPSQARVIGEVVYAEYNSTVNCKYLDTSFKPVAGQHRAVSLPTELADKSLASFLNKNPDGAIQILSRGVKLYPKSYLIASDLAAAYVMRYERLGDPFALIMALGFADRAVQINPALREARFNQALILELLHLYKQAGHAWKEYLQLEPKGSWASEVALRLKRINSETEQVLWMQARERLRVALLTGNYQDARFLVDRFRQFAQQYAEQELLGSWARSGYMGQSIEQIDDLRVAKRLGQLLLEVTGDAMANDSIAAILRAGRAQDNRSVSRLASGYQAYFEGIELYGSVNDQKALAKFSESFDLLQQEQSPFAKWALYRVALCQFYLGEIHKSLNILNRLGRQLGDSRYIVLRGKVHALQGMANARLANLGLSLKFYRTALSEFDTVGEQENISSVYFMIAENLRLLGELTESWYYRKNALALSGKVGGSIFYYTSLFDGAETSLRQGMPDVALAFQNEMVDFAVGDPLLSTETLIRRSRTYRHLRQFDAVDLDLSKAEIFLGRVAAGKRHQRLKADLELAKGESLLYREPQSALKPLEEALNIYRKQGEYFRLPDVFRMRSHARFSTGDFAGAEEDLEAGIYEVERQRESLDEDALRVSYFDQAHQIFDDMIRVLVERGDQERAFKYVERSRTRNLLEAFSRSIKPSNDSTFPSIDHIDQGIVGIEEIREQLPVGVVLVEFSILKDKSFVWIVTHDSAQLESLPVGSKWIEEKVTALRESILNPPVDDSSNFRKVSQDLFGALLGSLEFQLKRNRELIIVPDKSLALLPFAALIDPRTGKFLIQDHSVVFSPSATLYARGLERDRLLRLLRAGSSLRALVIGDPEFDPEVFINLPRLINARKEAQDVSALYKDSLLLLGRNATKKVFLEKANGFSVIHLGGHSVINNEFPLLSALLLGSSDAEKTTGMLYVHEIYRMKFSKTRLVVLASCASSLGPVSESEGVLSIARSFIAAGVPAVVGTSWPVDDQSSSQFLLRFHSSVVHGKSAATALRDAQLAFIDSQRKGGQGTALRDPRYWAGFQLIGGSFSGGH
jgi:CHAT domain-containing protein